MLSFVCISTKLLKYFIHHAFTCNVSFLSIYINKSVQEHEDSKQMQWKRYTGIYGSIDLSTFITYHQYLRQLNI